MKNNKGFTLFELMAVIVVLGLVLTIVVRSVIVSMDDAKKETEKVFVSKIEDAIEQYIDLNKRKFKIEESFGTKIIEKEISSDGKSKECVKVYKMKSDSDSDFTFNDIITDATGFIKESDLVNPAKEDDLCNKNTSIEIYRDEDFVYYFKTNLNCIVDANNQINTLPELKEECSN